MIRFNVAVPYCTDDRDQAHRPGLFRGCGDRTAEPALPFGSNSAVNVPTDDVPTKGKRTAIPIRRSIDGEWQCRLVQVAIDQGHHWIYIRYIQWDPSMTKTRLFQSNRSQDLR